MLDPPLLLPLQLADDVGSVSRLEPSTREAKPLSNKVKLSREHLLLLDELAKGVMVLAIVGDICDDAQIVGLDCGIAKLFKSGCTPDEHGVEPGREGNWDETCNRGGIDRFAERTLARFF